MPGRFGRSAEFLADLRQSVTDRAAAQDPPMARKPSLTYLGKPSALPASPGEAVLDRVPNKHPDTNYVARFAFPEFTCMCPVTGQPDFAIIMIDYVPKRWLIESKSLKLYLNSFRNHGAFHEECTVAIGKRMVTLLSPKWLRIGGYFYPRGGMPIDVFWQYGRLPKDVWVPDQGVPPYRARG
jgi:7-cyano-7-deazaguanine reductase